MNTKTPIEDAGAAQAAQLVQQTLRDVPRQSTSPVPPAHTVASIPQSQPMDELEALRLQLAYLKKVVADNYVEYDAHTKHIIPVVNTLNAHSVETRDLLSEVAKDVISLHDVAKVQEPAPVLVEVPVALAVESLAPAPVVENTAPVAGLPMNWTHHGR